MKKILYHIFLLLCIAVFCISAYKLYGYYKSYKEAKDTYEKIKKDNVKKTMHLKVISAYAVKAQDQMPITFANETQKKEYITKIRRMSEPSIKLDDKKIDRIYTFVTCSYERDDNRTYVHAVEE